MAPLSLIKTDYILRNLQLTFLRNIVPTIKKFATRVLIARGCVGPLESIVLRNLILTKAKCFPALSLVLEIAVDVLYARVPDNAGTRSPDENEEDDKYKEDDADEYEEENGDGDEEDDADDWS
jgi:hypothetical protein